MNNNTTIFDQYCSIISIIKLHIVEIIILKIVDINVVY